MRIVDLIYMTHMEHMSFTLFLINFLKKIKINLEKKTHTDHQSVRVFCLNNFNFF